MAPTPRRFLGNPNCDGAHCTSSNGEVRKLPTGNGNVILCKACFAHEIQFRKRNTTVFDWAARSVTWQQLEQVTGNDK